MWPTETGQGCMEKCAGFCHLFPFSQILGEGTGCPHASPPPFWGPCLPRLLCCCHQVCARAGGQGQEVPDTPGLQCCPPHCVCTKRAFWRWREASVFPYFEYLVHLKRKRKRPKIDAKNCSGYIGFQCLIHAFEHSYKYNGWVDPPLKRRFTARGLRPFLNEVQHTWPSWRSAPLSSLWEVRAPWWGWGGLSC